MSTTRILLAEDEAISRMDLREMLENLGYSVVGEAGDGVAAVNLARTLKPDLVLMDIQLPGIDGVEALRRLRADPLTAPIPVVALTAFAMKEDSRRFLGVGFDGYVTKPIAIRELPSQVRGFLGRGGRPADASGDR